MNVFEQAKVEDKKESSKKKAEVIKLEGQNADLLDEFCETKGKIKKYEAENEAINSSLLPIVQGIFFDKYEKEDKYPGSLSIAGHKEVASFVVQDKAKQYNAKEETVESLKSLLGEEKANELLEEEVEYSFNKKILNKDGVMEAISGAITKLVEEDAISEDDAADLLIQKKQTKVKKGTVQKLDKICKGDRSLMEQVFHALGSTVVSYLRT